VVLFFDERLFEWSALISFLRQCGWLRQPDSSALVHSLAGGMRNIRITGFRSATTAKPRLASPFNIAVES